MAKLINELANSELYKQEPPRFGREVREQCFAFAPGYINLNNGSFGATPVPVSNAVRVLNERIEANPDLFHRLDYQQILVDVRNEVAQFIGANADEVVLVANATTGVNTVLRNFIWEQGDTLVSFNTTYSSMDKSVQYLTDISPYPSRKLIEILFPTTVEHIIDTFKKFVANNPVAPGKKTVIIIDAIVSNPGVKFPWKELVTICKQARYWSVIDAAHSVGQETNINLNEVRPDFWVSNGYKWLTTKRSVTFLYVPRRNQYIIKSSVPTSGSYVSPPEQSLLAQFQWNGVIDYANYFSVSSALEFRRWLGGEEKISTYCHDLALKGGRRLAEIFNTQVLDPDGSFTWNMVNVELPGLDGVGPSSTISRKFTEKLLREHNAYAVSFYHNGRWWTRCSAQIWNDLDDFEKIGQIWLQVIKEVLHELIPEKRRDLVGYSSTSDFYHDL